MITRKELEGIARIKNISNLSYAEKDYLLEIVLFLISRETKKELVFKGGTALYKIYKLERFSEDLDFSEAENLDLDKLLDRILLGLSKFGIEAEVRKIKEPFNSILSTLRTKGPLYTGEPRSFSGIRIYVNKKSSIDLPPVSMRFSSLYNDIPGFDVLVMPEKEILAEKIRAIMTRHKAGDLFDAFSLIKKGIELDQPLIEKKLGYYNLTFSKNKLSLAINEKKAIWETELGPLIKEVPDFKEARKKILSAI